MGPIHRGVRVELRQMQSRFTRSLLFLPSSRLVFLAAVLLLHILAEVARLRVRHVVQESLAALVEKESGHFLVQLCASVLILRNV